jgi:carotenoid phi-ring synthase / carotenoid chi-ring synthase
MNAAGGRDRRAVRHRGPDGAPSASVLPWRPHAVVVGAGIAGLAAATGLAERGVQVTVAEREPYLGGRVGGWTEPSPGTGSPSGTGSPPGAAPGRINMPNGHGGDGTGVPGLPMSRGFHAFFRQYYNLRALLRRADPGLDRLVPLTDYPLVDATGRRDSFRGLPRTPPWNALAFALRSPTFRPRDLLALDAAAAAPLAAVSVPRIYEQLDNVDAETFLRRINFPAAARHLAFEVFSRSFFAPPGQMSAAELATMFHIYFLGSSEGLVFDVPDAGFDTALWDPLRGYLTARGVTFRTGTEITEVQLDGPRRFRVQTRGGARLDADAVVLATDVAGLRAIVGGSPDLAGSGDPAGADWRDRVAGLRTAPPFLVQRLWLDPPVDASRPAFLATGGLDPLDNISVLDRYDRQARDWARRQHGSVVELHAYAAPSEPGVGKRMIERLHALYPETGAARVVATAELWREDCPLFGVGDFARRPKVRTPVPGLVLAGDGIRIDLPVALMERAASTGWHAANCLLARWGLAGHTVYSVPTRGRFALLRWLAGHAREKPGAGQRQQLRETEGVRR